MYSLRVNTYILMIHVNTRTHMYSGLKTGFHDLKTFVYSASVSDVLRRFVYLISI